MAIDLRFILAVIKINGDLERIGDMAVSIAVRTLDLMEQDPLDLPGRVRVAGTPGSRTAWAPIRPCCCCGPMGISPRTRPSATPGR